MIHRGYYLYIFYNNYNRQCKKTLTLEIKYTVFLNIAHCSNELSSDGEMDTDSTLFYSLHKDCDGHLFGY